MKVSEIPAVNGAFATIPKILMRGQEELEIGQWTETIQTTIFFKSARIVRRVQQI